MNLSEIEEYLDLYRNIGLWMELDNFAQKYGKLLLLCIIGFCHP